MNSRTFGVMVALALAAIIMLTVLLDFVTARAALIDQEMIWYPEHHQRIKFEGYVTELYSSHERNPAWEPYSRVNIEVVLLDDGMAYRSYLSDTRKLTEVFDDGFTTARSRGDRAYPYNQGIHEWGFGVTQILPSGELVNLNGPQVYWGGERIDATHAPTRADIMGAEAMWFNLSWYTTDWELQIGHEDRNGWFTSQLYRVEDTTPVPEPTTALLFGVGLLGITSIIRRKVCGNSTKEKV